MKQSHRIALTVGAFIASTALVSTAVASPYAQTNLVSNVAGLAQITDPNLKNPWGMSFSAASPFWISNQGTNTSTLYAVSPTTGAVTKNAREVAIPTTATGPQGPTGQVFNSAGAGTFAVGGTAASFIFADLNGTISAWNAGAGTSSVVMATTPGRVYTGLALAGTGAAARLYAASAAGIDVFNSSFAPVSVAGGFVNNDPRLAGLVPFNVQTIGTSVYVTYAAPGRTAQLSAAEGSGAVAIFDTAGNLQSTLIAGSKLASPWGLAIAPSGFGGFSGDLLVGNFSFAVAEINAFDPLTGAYLGTIADQTGNAFINSGLWGIAFGNGVSGDSKTLYFNAGINNEVDGLFGSIKAIPEPESLLLIVVGLGALALRSRRRAQH